MYISKEVHDALCEAGVWACGIMLGTMTLAVVLPWLWKKTRFMRAVLKIKLAYALDMAMLKHQRRIEKCRYKAAMKVFDKPLSDAYKTIGRMKK